jgi:hypothetical protein
MQHDPAMELHPEYEFWGESAIGHRHVRRKQMISILYVPTKVGQCREPKVISQGKNPEI